MERKNELVVNRKFVKKLKYTRGGLASLFGFVKSTNSDHIRNALLESGVCEDSERRSRFLKMCLIGVM
jgi:hypothetical protein